MWPEVLRADGASPVLKQSWARAKAPRGLRLVRKLRADEAPSARKTKRSRCNTGTAYVVGTWPLPMWARL